MLDRQLKQLAKVKGVTIDSQQWIDRNPKHQLYLPGHVGNGKGYYGNGKGHQQIEFTLRCKAVMDCDPRRRQDGKKYKLSSKDIVISDIHHLVCCFPRGYPNDPIGWGLYFRGKIPLYPNIISFAKRAGVPPPGVLRFSGTPTFSGASEGIICIGAAASLSGTAMHELIGNLRSFLLMKEEKLFTHTTQQGNNDGGFDPALLHHYSMNYDTIKRALDSYSGRRRLGPAKRKRRKLGN
jgi:hypothetical protein